MCKHLNAMNMEFRDGRPTSASNLLSVKVMSVESPGTSNCVRTSSTQKGWVQLNGGTWQRRDKGARAVRGIG